MNKICNKCKNNLPYAEFHKCKSKKDGLQTFCKKCNNDNAKKDSIKNKKRWTQRLKEKREKYRKDFLTYKSTLFCCVCKENTSCCLDFHHLNHKKKNGEISSMFRNRPLEKLKQELEKCVVLCSNCHRKLHAGLIKLN